MKKHGWLLLMALVAGTLACQSERLLSPAAVPGAGMQQVTVSNDVEWQDWPIAVVSVCGTNWLAGTMRMHLQTLNQFKDGVWISRQHFASRPTLIVLSPDGTEARYQQQGNYLQVMQPDGTYRVTATFNAREITPGAAPNGSVQITVVIVWDGTSLSVESVYIDYCRG